MKRHFKVENASVGVTISSTAVRSPSAGPYQTLPPKVVMKMRSRFRGSGMTRWAPLKLYPRIRSQVCPRSSDRHAEDWNPAA